MVSKLGSYPNFDQQEQSTLIRIQSDHRYIQIIFQILSQIPDGFQDTFWNTIFKFYEVFYCIHTKQKNRMGFVWSYRH